MSVFRYENMTARINSYPPGRRRVLVGVLENPYERPGNGIVLQNMIGAVADNQQIAIGFESKTDWSRKRRAGCYHSYISPGSTVIFDDRIVTGAGDKEITVRSESQTARLA